MGAIDGLGVGEDGGYEVYVKGRGKRDNWVSR